MHIIIITDTIPFALLIGSFFITMGRPTRNSVLRGIGTALLGAVCIIVGVFVDGVHLTLSGIVFAVIGATFFWVAVPTYLVLKRKWAMVWRITATGVLLASLVVDGLLIHLFMFPRI